MVTAAVPLAAAVVVVVVEPPTLLRRDEVDAFSFSSGNPAVSVDEDVFIDEVDVFNDEEVEEVDVLSLLELRRAVGETPARWHEACAVEMLARGRREAVGTAVVLAVSPDEAAEAAGADPSTFEDPERRTLAGRLERFLAINLARWLAVVADATPVFASMSIFF